MEGCFLLHYSSSLSCRGPVPAARRPPPVSLSIWAPCCACLIATAPSRAGRALTSVCLKRELEKETSSECSRISSRVWGHLPLSFSTLFSISSAALPLFCLTLTKRLQESSFLFFPLLHPKCIVSCWHTRLPRSFCSYLPWCLWRLAVSAPLSSVFSLIICQKSNPHPPEPCWQGRQHFHCASESILEKSWDCVSACWPEESDAHNFIYAISSTGTLFNTTWAWRQSTLDSSSTLNFTSNVWGYHTSALSVKVWFPSMLCFKAFIIKTCRIPSLNWKNIIRSLRNWPIREAYIWIKSVCLCVCYCVCEWERDYISKMDDLVGTHSSVWGPKPHEIIDSFLGGRAWLILAVQWEVTWLWSNSTVTSVFNKSTHVSIAAPWDMCVTCQQNNCNVFLSCF